MILEVNNIRKQFEGTEVLKGISLSVDKGDVVAILGPSGSGKTTLLRCINFLERADSGILTFDQKEHDLSRIRRREIADIRKNTAFVFQNYNLFLNQTVLQNVTAGLIHGRGMKKAEAVKIAMECLERVGMADKAKAYPAQLSGGQQQRVAIARGLATSPEIIYFDEPTSALDPELIDEVLSVMRELAEDGMTMLVVTHEMNFARYVSNKVIFMEDGNVVESASAEQFFTAPRTERAARFIQTVLQRNGANGNDNLKTL